MSCNKQLLHLLNDLPGQPRELILRCPLQKDFLAYLCASLLEHHQRAHNHQLADIVIRLFVPADNYPACWAAILK